MGVVHVIQIVDEHEIRYLLDDIQRVCDSTCPENVPKRINPVLELPCDHTSILCTLYGIKIIAVDSLDLYRPSGDDTHVVLDQQPDQIPPADKDYVRSLVHLLGEFP